MKGGEYALQYRQTVTNTITIPFRPWVYIRMVQIYRYDDDELAS